jgi:hypothetical protein
MAMLYLASFKDHPAWVSMALQLAAVIAISWDFVTSRKPVGSRSLSLSEGMMVVGNAEHWISRAEIRRWGVVGTKVLLVGDAVKWTLVTAPQDQPTLCAMLDRVLGPATNDVTASISRRVAYTVVAVLLGGMLLVAGSMLRVIPVVVAASLAIVGGVAVLLHWGLSNRQK